MHSSLLPGLPRDGLPVINPATGELLAHVPEMNEDATVAAIEQAASPLQLQPSRAARADWLRVIANELLNNRDDLARIITLEQGKPLAEARTEVEYAAGFFAFFAEKLDLLAPRELPEKLRGAAWTVHHRPAGVAALITPWNFPLAMLAKKLSAALAAGCSTVIKPAELTPLSALALGAAAHRAGVPAAYVNIVTGKPQPIGQVMCSHPAVRVLSFTGSTATGKLLLGALAPHIKRPAMELGGNAPFIVFEDADIEAAAEALIANKFRCAGQTCVCANRVYVQQSVLERFTEAIVPRVAQLKVGNGLEPGVHIGPLINRAGWKKVRRHVDDALARGARRVQGADSAPPAHDWGCFYPPTVLTGCDGEMEMFREETFGPVIGIAAFNDEAEVIAQANGTPYGLAAYLFTADAARAERCAAALQFGHVAINSGTGPTPEAPFGGMKQSGMGREGGDEGLLEFVEFQTVVTA